MGNETEEREIEGVDSENEGMEPENEGVENEVLTTKQKGYILSNPPMSNTAIEEPLGTPWDKTI